jgi:hypothetical protein
VNDACFFGINTGTDAGAVLDHALTPKRTLFAGYPLNQHLIIVTDNH